MRRWISSICTDIYMYDGSGSGHKCHTHTHMLQWLCVTGDGGRTSVIPQVLMLVDGFQGNVCRNEFSGSLSGLRYVLNNRRESLLFGYTCYSKLFPPEVLSKLKPIVSQPMHSLSA